MRKNKILIVDDHQDILGLLTLQIRHLGWEAIPVRSGRAALAELEELIPDVILLDMWMPEMDGFQLARLIRRNPVYRDIPILAVTGMGIPDAREMCLRAGCSDCIFKPFRLQDLRERLINLMSPATKSDALANC